MGFTRRHKRFWITLKRSLPWLLKRGKRIRSLSEVTGKVMEQDYRKMVTRGQEVLALLIKMVKPQAWAQWEPWLWLVTPWMGFTFNKAGRGVRQQTVSTQIRWGVQLLKRQNNNLTLPAFSFLLRCCLD